MGDITRQQDGFRIKSEGTVHRFTEFSWDLGPDAVAAWGAIALDNNLIKRSKQAVVHTRARIRLATQRSATALQWLSGARSWRGTRGF